MEGGLVNPVLTARLEHIGQSCVVCLVGDLTLPTTVDVRNSLHKALAGQPALIVVDLEGTTIRDGLALLAFSTFARTASAWPGCPVVIYAPQPATRAELDRMAVNRAMPIFADRTAALAAVNDEAPRMFRLRLMPTPTALAAARQLVGDACTGWHVEQVRADAELAITELVANVVRHARSPMEVGTTYRDNFLHLSVRDGNVRKPIRTLADPETGEGGRGLILLDAITSAWGCTPLPDGKVVWAALRIRR
jgi:anti-anti-sigma regulatory factor/anti-sigma regulatory factor (Ser/Thr protein kinase)